MGGSCNNDYLACVDGAAAEVTWDAALVATKAGTLTNLSSDSLSVSWSVSGPSESLAEPIGDGAREGMERIHRASGAARASRGVQLGRWYFEVRVGGPCGVVGVGQEDFDITGYPGFNAASFGFGDAGFGGELFNDAGEASYDHLHRACYDQARPSSCPRARALLLLRPDRAYRAERIRFPYSGA